jgi:hypothetical protein
MKVLEAARKKDLLARKSTRDTMLDLTLDMVANDEPAAPPTDKKLKLNQGDGDADSDDDDDDNIGSAIKNATDDPQLDEAVNIMTDYTQLLRNSGSALVQSSPGTVVTKPATP